MWEQQQNQFFRGNAYGCNWVNGANVPGLNPPLSGPRNGFTPMNRIGSLCISNDGGINVTGNLTAISADGQNRDISMGIIIRVGGTININYNLNLGEVLSWQNTAAGSQNTVSEITMWTNGNRSPDNICLYGTESPIEGQDYFRGDRYKDWRDENGELG